MPTIEKATEKFTVLYRPDSSSTTLTAPSTLFENFTAFYIPTTEFTEGGVFYEFFSVFTWTPIFIDICEQFYREIFHVTWIKYNETEFAEFNHYELHRKIGTFTPAPGDPTLIYQTTDANILEYYDITPDENADWHYAVICVLDDGRYALSVTIDANNYPVWGAEWPDVLIHNNGNDSIPQNTEYACESTIATDPEGATVIYKFQFCQRFTSPQNTWTFTFGVNPVPRYINCLDKRIIISAPAGYGVKVNGELWTLAGNLPSDLLAYGPTDKVFIYDEELNFIVFGDGVNGKLPANPDVISAHYSSWADIETDTSLELNNQLWKIGELSIGSDYRMRIFPMDNLIGKRGFADISEFEFSIQPELNAPILVYPADLEPEVNTYWPHFQFYGISVGGGPLLYAFEASDDPTFTTTLQTSDMSITPSEWQKKQYTNGEMVYFTPLESKPIISPLNKRGPYYWRVRMYDIGWNLWSKWSEPFKYNVEGATFYWYVGLTGDEKRFRPDRDGWNVEITQVGREKVEKRVFRCIFAAMSEQQYEIMKTEFGRRTALSLYDNMGDNYTVYWGECERSLNGKAFFPDTPVFGIMQKNYIPGALRYWGECVFTEV